MSDAPPPVPGSPTPPSPSASPSAPVTLANPTPTGATGDKPATAAPSAVVAAPAPPPPTPRAGSAKEGAPFPLPQPLKSLYMPVSLAGPFAETLSSDERKALEKEVRQHVAVLKWEELLSYVDPIANWGRRNSIWPFGFGLACCAIEMICTAASRYDISRFGAELFRGSPRQADVIIVSGTVTKKMIPMIVRLWNQMPEPKFCISMGACATGGGPFKEGYNVVSGVDEYIPVDVYVPGCPPTPSALLNGLIQLQKKIAKQSSLTAPWYNKKDPREVPVPILGPDLVDRRQLAEIRQLGKEGAPPKPAPPMPKFILASKLDGAAVVAPAPVPAVAAAAVVVTPAPPSPAAVTAADLVSRINAKLGDGTASKSGETIVVETKKIADVAKFLRDTPGLQYNYLANLTSTDYQDCYEVVYHLASIQRGGKPVTLKARADKANPVVPSLAPFWPGANFQEREVFDLMGIRFEGHPYMTRILMWEGFQGHPLRKDYLEGYYEEPAKMFSSRWRDGWHKRGEERNPYHRNVVYPKGWTAPEAELKEYDNSYVDNVADHTISDGVTSDTVVVNLGPQHPSTHGVFRMKVLLDGEKIVRLEPIFGYLHRNHEKIGERNSWLMNFPFTDRLDYLTSMGNNFGYALTVEKLLGVKVPERAEYLRVIMAELTRCVSHLWGVGFLINDLGAFFTPSLYGIEEREMVLDLFEAASGSRMMCNYFRFGGVAWDVPESFVPLANKLVNDRLPRLVDELDRYLTKNEIVLSRTRNVGVLTAEEAIAHSAAGPVLRGSGVPYDIRKSDPYGIYDRFDFDVVTYPTGDIYGRFWVRMQEIRQSLRILRQALDQLPGGDILPAKKLWNIKVPAGESYGRVENPKGELGYYAVSDGGTNAYRYHIRSPSFINLTALEKMCMGNLVADSIAILGSTDIVLGEVDR